MSQATELSEHYSDLEFRIMENAGMSLTELVNYALEYGVRLSSEEHPTTVPATDPDGKANVLGGDFPMVKCQLMVEEIEDFPHNRTKTLSGTDEKGVFRKTTVTNGIAARGKVAVGRIYCFLRKREATDPDGKVDVPEGE